MTLAGERVIQVQSPDIAALLREHSDYPGVVHDNLEVESCVCSLALNTALGPVPVRVVTTFVASDGPSCANCGNITVLQGSCWLCQTCGNTTGCG